MMTIKRVSAWMLCIALVSGTNQQRELKKLEKNCIAAIQKRMFRKGRVECPREYFENWKWKQMCLHPRLCFLKPRKTGKDEAYSILKECKPLVDHTLRQRKQDGDAAKYETFSVRLTQVFHFRHGNTVYLEIQNGDKLWGLSDLPVRFLKIPGAKEILPEDHAENPVQEQPRAHPIEANAQPMAQPNGQQGRTSREQSRGQMMEEPREHARRHPSKKRSNHEWIFIIGVVVVFAILCLLCLLGAVAFAMMRRRR